MQEELKSVRCTGVRCEQGTSKNKLKYAPNPRHSRALVLGGILVRVGHTIAVIDGLHFAGAGGAERHALAVVALVE